MPPKSKTNYENKGNKPTTMSKLMMLIFLHGNMKHHPNNLHTTIIIHYRTATCEYSSVFVTLIPVPLHPYKYVKLDFAIPLQDGDNR